VSIPPSQGSASGLVRWLKFNAVGAIGIGVQLAVLTLLKSGLGLNYLLGTALAVETTVLHNFLWHERFTWSDRPTRDRLRRLLTFNLTTGLFSIAGNVAFTYVLVRAGAAYLPANVISIALCSIVNFFLNDRLVFVVSPRRGGSFRMTQRWIVLLSALLFSCGSSRECRAQNPVIGTCAAFAGDGALATGTLRDGDLETKVEQRAVVATTRTGLARTPFRGLSRLCEEAFSDDGKWLATVVAGDELTIVIFDRNAKAVHGNFSSEWYGLRNLPIEPGYRSSFLGGFLQDDSLILWRYVPRAGTKVTDASNADVHLQRWSVEGELLSDQNLGAVGGGPGGRQPIALDRLSLLWIPSKCEGFCFRGVRVSGGQIADAATLKLPNDAAEPVALPGDEGLFAVVGRRTAEKAALFDSSGRLEAQVNLPFFPNLLWPLVPDWFVPLSPTISHDGEVAAIGRTRVAWVLEDTDRDWGSEIVLLRMHPLTVTARVKTGKGGIGAIAVDHRNRVTRLVGFWKGSWHELQCAEQHPDKCR